MTSPEVGAFVPTLDAVEVFCSYSRKDEALREELETHLIILQANGVISSWHDHAIPAGTQWADQIDEHLNSAQIILLLVSPDFLASKYCREVEVKRALERHKAGEARVIPIMLRDVDWHGSALSNLQALPKDAKPVVNWPNHDQAFKEIVIGIRKVAEGLRDARKQPPAKLSFPEKSELPPQPPPIDAQSQLMRYVGFGAIVVVLLAGLAYLAMRRPEQKDNQPASTDWTKLNFDSPLLGDCNGNPACVARARHAATLEKAEWTKVSFDSPLLSDCMAYPVCVERATHAATLEKAEWTKVSFDSPLLSDCMAYPVCVERARIETSKKIAKAPSRPKVYVPPQSKTGGKTEYLDPSPPMFQHQP